MCSTCLVINMMVSTTGLEVKISIIDWYESHTVTSASMVVGLG